MIKGVFQKIQGWWRARLRCVEEAERYWRMAENGIFMGGRDFSSKMIEKKQKKNGK